MRLYFALVFIVGLLGFSKAHACAIIPCETLDQCLNYSRTHFSGSEDCGGTGVSVLDPENYSQENSDIWMNEYFSARFPDDKIDLNASEMDYSDYDFPQDPNNEVRRFVRNENAWGDSLKQAIKEFRNDENDKAFDHFKAILNESKSDLVNEYVSYLAGRAALRQAQKDWDGYQPVDKVRLDWLKKSEEEFTTYLKVYPEGNFAASAQGLLRRVAYLQGASKRNQELLYQAFEDAMTEESISYVNVFNLTLEGFTTIPLKEIDRPHPLMWPVLANYVARDFPELSKDEAHRALWKQVTKEDVLNKLLKQKEDFKNYPSAWRLSVGTLQMRLGKFAQGLLLFESLSKEDNAKLLPSEVALKARLLIGLKRFTEARSVMAPKIKSSKGASGLEKLYLYSYHWEGNTTAAYFDELIEPGPEAALYDLSNDQLVELLNNPKLNTKTRDKLIEPAFARLMWTQQWDLVPKVTAPLKGKAKDLSGALKIYYKDRSVTNLAKVLTFFPDQELFLSRWCEEKFKTFGEFKPLIDYYVETLEALKDLPKNELEAQTLNNAILCFKTSNLVQSCFLNGNKENYPQKLRKTWFQRLHKKYPKSQWRLNVFY